MERYLTNSKLNSTSIQLPKYLFKQFDSGLENKTDYIMSFLIKRGRFRNNGYDRDKVIFALDKYNKHDKYAIRVSVVGKGRNPIGWIVKEMNRD